MNYSEFKKAYDEANEKKCELSMEYNKVKLPEPISLLKVEYQDGRFSELLEICGDSFGVYIFDKEYNEIKLTKEAWETIKPVVDQWFEIGD